MPDTVIHKVEQLDMRDWQPAALDFTFGLGLDIVDLPPNPENEVDDYARTIAVKLVAAQDTEQQM